MTLTDEELKKAVAEKTAEHNVFLATHPNPRAEEGWSVPPNKLKKWNKDAEPTRRAKLDAERALGDFYHEKYGAYCLQAAEEAENKLEIVHIVRHVKGDNGQRLIRAGYRVVEVFKAGARIPAYDDSHIVRTANKYRDVVVWKKGD